MSGNARNAYVTPSVTRDSRVSSDEPRARARTRPVPLELQAGKHVQRELARATRMHACLRISILCEEPS